MFKLFITCRESWLPAVHTKPMLQNQVRLHQDLYWLCRGRIVVGAVLASAPSTHLACPPVTGWPTHPPFLSMWTLSSPTFLAGSCAPPSTQTHVETLVCVCKQALRVCENTLLTRNVRAPEKVSPRWSCWWRAWYGVLRIGISMLGHRAVRAIQTKSCLRWADCSARTASSIVHVCRKDARMPLPDGFALSW